MGNNDQKAIDNFRKRLAEGYLPSKRFYQPKNTVEQIKMELCETINYLYEQAQLTNKDLAFLCKSSEEESSQMLNYRIELFSIDFLVEKIESLLTSFKNNSVEVSPLPTFSSTLNSLRK